jgi:hypothetical protein
MTDAERIITAWRESGCPVDVFISTKVLGVRHRILGWIIEFEGAPGVHAKDSCFVLLPKGIFDHAKRVDATGSGQGTTIEIEYDACQIRMTDQINGAVIGNA